MKRQTLFSSALALSSILLLASCAADLQEAPAQSPSASTSHSGHSMSQSVAANDADMAFASGMKMHHEQAIEMSDILLEKESIPEDIAALAARIKVAQSPEIERMDRWLADWGMSDLMDHPSMEHGDGMVPKDEIKALKEASGKEAAKLFLEQMITHHEGAVDMAETEINEGSYPAAIDLAQDIVKSQNDEIHEMKQLLAAL